MQDFITLDTSHPSTALAPSGPQGTVNTNLASFSFTSEDGATFECRLTRQGEPAVTFTVCSSPKDYTDLADGSYTFEVRARDGAGNVDMSPASRTWTVDLTAPETTITGPSGFTSNNKPTFGFAGSDNTSCEYTGGWLWATSPVGLTQSQAEPRVCLCSDLSVHPGRRPLTARERLERDFIGAR